MLLRTLTIVEFAIGVLPLSLLWAFGAWLMVVEPLRHWNASTSVLGVGIMATWISACGAGLLALWLLFFRYSRYAVSGVPAWIKISAALGLIGLMPLVLDPVVTAIRGDPAYLQSISVWTYLAILIPPILLLQFQLLIARERQSSNVFNTDAPTSGRLANSLGSTSLSRRTLVVVVVISLGSALWVISRPMVTSPIAHLSPVCQAAAGIAPLDFQELSAMRKKVRSEKMQYLGECNAKKVTDDFWFVSGVHYNNWMKEDGRPPVRYEAVFFENNDATDLYVQRLGTQYITCGVAAEGIDRTKIRYKRCGLGAYILEFKKLHAL